MNAVLAHADLQPAPSPRPRGLWIGRDLPFPIDEGDRTYAAYLARSLAEAGVGLEYLGLAPESGLPPPADWPIRWSAVAPGKTPRWQALFSPLPLIAATYRTPAYLQALRERLAHDWDLIVIDQYGSGWALEEINKAYSSAAGRVRPVVVHTSHNHEASLWQDLARNYRGNPLKKWVFQQNAWKVARFERNLVQGTDLVGCITPEDQVRYAQQVGIERTVLLTPGYSGKAMAARTIGHDTPRKVIVVGSYTWVVKQENLRAFVTAADPVFERQGISLEIVGRMPAHLQAELESFTRATRFAGFVDDLEPHLASSRMAVVPEVFGGGFKLKLLDYVFGRVPVVSLRDAAAGLPPALLEQVCCCDSLAELVDTIVSRIDAVEELDQRQKRAFALAQAGFRWSDRGEALLAAVHRARGVPGDQESQ